jgi:hypothetical protein
MVWISIGSGITARFSRMNFGYNSPTVKSITQVDRIMLWKNSLLFKQLISYGFYFINSLYLRIYKYGQIIIETRKNPT